MNNFEIETQRLIIRQLKISDYSAWKSGYENMFKPIDRFDIKKKTGK